MAACAQSAEAHSGCNNNGTFMSCSTYSVQACTGTNSGSCSGTVNTSCTWIPSGLPCGTSSGPINGSWQAATGQYCPDNSTEYNASTCQCVTGYVSNGTDCIPAQLSCREKLQAESISYCLSSSGCAWPIREGQREACLPGPARNCVVQFYFRALGHNGYWWGADTRVVAADCGPEMAELGDSTPVPPDEDARACKAGLCPGIVNGTKVCAPCAESETDGTTQTKTDGSKDKTSTKCVDGLCTTTTEAFDPAGVKTGETVTTESLGSYCSRYPLSGHCAGVTNNGGGAGKVGYNTEGGGGDGTCEGEDCGDGSAWGGSCASQFTCDGDAVQCAIAQDQHIRHCAMFDDANELSDVGNPAMDGNLRPDGHPFEAPGEVSMDFGAVIDQTDLIGAACPADYVFPYGGGSLSIPFSRYCSELAMLGNLLVGVAMLAAVVIVFKH